MPATSHPPSASDRVLLGIWQQIPLPAVSRYLASLGWDWVVLDLQHGALGLETAYECVHVLRQSGAVPLVRVGVGRPEDIERALDIGAGGVVVPMVNSVAEAREAAAHAKYPPLGRRSLGGDCPIHCGPDYPERANRDTLLLVQIEHIDAVNAAEDILAVDGVDGFVLGPNDLALSMGLSPKAYRDVPEHRAAVSRALRACLGLGKLACTNTFSREDFAEKLAQGFRCLTFRSEVDLLLSAGRDLLGALRGAVERGGTPSA